MANRFILNETAYFGAGARQVLEEEITKRNLKRALVITDADLIKFSVAKKVTDVLTVTPYEIFSDVQANPTIKNVKDAVSACKNAKADFIIAIRWRLGNRYCKSCGNNNK